MKQQKGKDKIDILNELLKSVFIQGIRVGVCFSQDKKEDLLGEGDHFKEDGLIDNDMQYKVEKLAKLIGIVPEDIVIYTKEVAADDEKAWRYIIPFVDFKETK